MVLYIFFSLIGVNFCTSVSRFINLESLCSLYLLILVYENMHPYTYRVHPATF